MPVKKRVVLLEGIHPLAQEKLEEAGFEVHRESMALRGEELYERVRGASALGIRSKTQLGGEALGRLRHLDVIGAFCIGTNQIALEVAEGLGIPVFNAPHSNTRSVAELILAEMVVLARKLFDRSAQVHRGVWEKSSQGAFELRGKTLGIVGYGHIGSQLSVLAEALGIKVLFYDIAKKLPMGNAHPVQSLEELLKVSDFVSLHVPATPRTRWMMNAERLRSMKRGAFLLNASRGNVVDLGALGEALRAKHLAGAAIDVFPEEPQKNKDVFQTDLQGVSNVVLTPHIGGSTEEAQVAIGVEVAESLICYLKWGQSLGAVNFPNADVLELGGGRRLLNIHRNVPGVLGEINGIVSEAGANIKHQSLSTNGEIGYLIMDMELDHADSFIERISLLETSIKTRVI